MVDRYARSLFRTLGARSCSALGGAATGRGHIAEDERHTMTIVELHSHLGGHEYILVHAPELWRDLEAAVAVLNPDDSGEGICASLSAALRERGWREPVAEGGRCSDNDLLRDRVAVSLHLGEPPSVASELFARHMAFYVGDLIDVGVEILPVKAMQQEMSSGIAYYEGELYNLIRQGRSVPAVPLVLVGLSP